MTLVTKRQNKRGHMGAMCYTQKEISSSGLKQMKERGEIKENKWGKRKGERNGGPISDTSLDLQQDYES